MTAKKPPRITLTQLEFAIRFCDDVLDHGHPDAALLAPFFARVVAMRLSTAALGVKEVVLDLENGHNLILRVEKQ